jgi:cell division protein FtsI (penicillin-binding protein 3)
VYADPSFIKDTGKISASLADVLGGKPSDYADKMADKKRRYVILKKRVSKESRDKLLALEYPGIGAQEQSYRTYPQGGLAGQVLGFVTEDGKGTYGVEQAMNGQLTGTPGELKAITDARGVPLVASSDNIEVQPKAGQDVLLTIDIGIQKQVERLLVDGAKRARSNAVSAVVVDPRSGAIKAMANYPSYDPSKFQEVEDPNLFNNPAITHPIEIGSIMKTLTVAAALDQGVITKDTSYYDPASYVVDGFRITNIEEDGGPGQRNMKQLLNLSLNTGATWALMQMGDGKLNQKARGRWYDYMAQRYMFGKPTGVEQGYEEGGTVPKPEDNGAGINLTYANTSFGQAMTATPLQTAAALSAVVNGGTYYKPRLVDGTVGADGKVTRAEPVVLRDDVVSDQVSHDIIPMLQYVVDNHGFRPGFDQSRYSVGGKTGTAQIANPQGGYFKDDYNGTYLGFAGGDEPQYVIAVFVHKPKIAGYAGSAAAQPLFGDIAHMLINNGYVTPRSR